MIFSSKRKVKIFCVGLNKTGTTSLFRTLENLNFKMGDQRSGELLFRNWVKNDFDPIIQYTKSSMAFQDIPFSLPSTYGVLDKYYVNSKFILSVRDSPEQWYNSVVKFHSKLWGDGRNPPTAVQLKSANYLYKGFPFEFSQIVWKTPENDPYNKDILIDHYRSHNCQVKEYFKDKKEKLITINVSCNSDYSRLCDFLNRKSGRSAFFWENKTAAID